MTKFICLSNILLSIMESLIYLNRLLRISTQKIEIILFKFIFENSCEFNSNILYKIH